MKIPNSTPAPLHRLSAGIGAALAGPLALACKIFSKDNSLPRTVMKNGLFYGMLCTKVSEKVARYAYRTLQVGFEHLRLEP